MEISSVWFIKTETIVNINNPNIDKNNRKKTGVLIIISVLCLTFEERKNKKADKT